ncbi:hypothetical protein KCP69_17895 [Salmonella enterica subsp. enterica]|nr:hypothetical protein KCP69_17895 [Salmonella enterica subsp. enterica]
MTLRALELGPSILSLNRSSIREGMLAYSEMIAEKCVPPRGPASPHKPMAARQQQKPVRCSSSEKLIAIGASTSSTEAIRHVCAAACRFSVHGGDCAAYTAARGTGLRHRGSFCQISV